MYRNPKNFKRGTLIGNRFRMVDLMLLIGFAVLSSIAVILTINVMPGGQFLFYTFIIILELTPFGIMFILTSYRRGFHNFLLFFYVMFKFYNSTQKKFMWEGIVYYED